MGDPFLILNKVTVKVDGFYFNVAMTVFREEWEKRQERMTDNSVVARMVSYIGSHGLESITDTVLEFDQFITTEKNRIELAHYLRVLMTRVLQPDFHLPEKWQRVLRGEIGGTPPIPITREHFLGIAYIYQVMLDLIEGRIQEGSVRRNRPPPDWML